MEGTDPGMKSELSSDDTDVCMDAPENYFEFCEVKAEPVDITVKEEPDDNACMSEFQSKEEITILEHHTDLGRRVDVTASFDCDKEAEIPAAQSTEEIVDTQASNSGVPGPTLKTCSKSRLNKQTVQDFNKGFGGQYNLSVPDGLQIKKKSHKCVICGQCFTLGSNLSKHLLLHSGIKKYKCEMCEKAFTRRGHLSSHTLTHLGIKQYKCNICEKTFTHLSGLSSHKVTHSGIKQFKCTTCEKSFAQHGHLSRHMLTHSGIKQYKCDVCQKSFTQHVHLSGHMLIHSGKKQYKCDTCNKLFLRRRGLSRHLLIHSK